MTAALPSSASIPPPATPVQPLLEVDRLAIDIHGRQGPVRALDGVSFTIAPGEILGMVGESGAGKSLTGAALIGLLDPPLARAGGRILLDDERIDTLTGEALRMLRGRRIGAIFQDPLTSLNPLFTIGDQLIETLRELKPLSTRAARQRAIELLAEVGIPGAGSRLDTFPHQLSGGMRQRVVIALALAGDPRLVVADEPTTALDVSIQAQILALLRRACRERGTAVLLVTHDMGVIAQTADRVAVMYAGRLVEIGPVEQIIRAPRHPYTAGLIASIPVIGRRRERLAQIDGTMPRPGATPPGCAFHPRCAQRLPVCMTQAPIETGDSASRVACWLQPAPAGEPPAGAGPTGPTGPSGPSGPIGTALR